MSFIGTALFTCLDSVDRPGDFCVDGLREGFMPAVEVDGVGQLAFPLPPAQAKELIAIAERAPYGRGEETLVDEDVRRTWQIDPARVRIGGRHWPRTLEGLVADAALGLGVTEPIAADFYKLLVYDAGSFFVDHRDTEKVPGMFATMVLVLPSVHSGGALVVRHLGREVVLDPRPQDASEIGFAAFYADCVHEIRPVVGGYRLAMVYNLRFLGTAKLPEPPDYRGEQQQLTEKLRLWTEAADEPDKLIFPLEHAYTQATLSFGTLKGRDAAVASVLVGAAAAAKCDLHLALVSIEEEGSAEYTGYYVGRGWGGDEEDDQFEAGEIFDRSLTLSQWRRPDGSEAPFGPLPFVEDELCPADAFEDLTPDEEHFHEATGNEGASFERSYRRAGLVLWPCNRRLVVLNQAGLGATLPYLEELKTRWDDGGADPGSPLWNEADELVGHMLSTWPRPSWPLDDNNAGRVLDSLVRLGNAARIEEFLTDLSAQGCYGASDNAAIVRAAALLPRRRATELLARIISRNLPAHLGACAELLRRCVEAPAGPVGDPTAIGAALLDALPGYPAKAPPLNPWQRSARPEPGFVVDLLTGLSRIDVDLGVRATEHLLAWPNSYGADKVLVPAALAFAGEAASKEWPGVERLRSAALGHLRQRIALPLEAPSDGARQNPLKCACADCSDLGQFLIDTDKQLWRLKAAQTRRVHVEQSVRNAPCDLDLTTEKRSSPHVLVATKNQASYERRAAQRRLDLEHVSVLEY